MSNNPMVEQVNRLVANLLSASGEIALPGVGSLYVERQGAKRLSKRLVLPPSRVISFTSQMRGESLVEAIAAAAQCDQAQAQEVYERWLTRTREGDALTIEGVGVLKFKNFTLSPAFDHILNPQGREPVRIRAPRRVDWVLWFGVTAIVLVAAGGATLWLTNGNPLAELWFAQKARVAVVEPAPAEQPLLAEQPALAEHAVAEESSAEAADRVVVAPAEVVQPEVSADEEPLTPVEDLAQPQSSDAGLEIKSAGTPAMPARFVAGRRYVVLGVFSTPENATRAVREAVERAPEMRCSVYRFGTKLMVTVFDADQAEPCAEFIARNGERFPGMWTYIGK